MSERGHGPSPAPPSARLVRPAAALLALAGFLAYANALRAPFVFDDLVAVVGNPSIRHLASALLPPATAGSAAGRPLVNATFAINYALGGEDVTGYHALNLLIHLAATLVLFGFLRRTFLLPPLRDRFPSAALPVAFFSALLWTVHPLLTESVTCIVQRTESLASLWLLLTLYCLVRAAESAVARRWLAGSFAACLLGTFTKEIVVVAPLLAVGCQALLIDGSWRTAWNRRRGFFGLLALTWLPLAWFIMVNGPRHGSGFRTGVSSWEYALTQARAVALYLKLAFWPNPLVLDYGTTLAHSFAAVWPQALLLAVLAGATAVAAVRRMPAAFAGIWFFGILAPSSSVVPLVTQTIAEHRMYLPLAGVVVPLVAGAWALAGRRSAVAFVALAVVLAILTVRRNAVYQSTLGLWDDTVAKAPDNPRAWTNLGNALDEGGREDEALRAYDRALVLSPSDGPTHYNLGNLYARRGQPEKAIEHFQAAVRAEPGDAAAHAKLGVLLVATGRDAEGRAQLHTALQLDPDNAMARDELARLAVAGAPTNR
ncbi:MAG TPA: tetratricopeptide repeat protein [Lacunisphaera sp.]|nr:tetratricopeptide repeat protein [Lacunisphaera sp.]